MVKYIGVSYSYVAKSHRIRNWTFSYELEDTQKGIVIYDWRTRMIIDRWKKAKLIL